MIWLPTKIFALVVFLSALALPAFAFKHQMQTMSIPMRDGKSLAADVYLPSQTGKWPVVLIQTPYNRKTFRLVFPFEVSQDPLLKSSDYAFVVTDWRGYFDSAPAAVNGYDRGLDGHDTVEWIAAQSWSNGMVGTWGASALGVIQFQTASKRPPHLRACVPIVAHARETYEIYYGGGVYYRNKNSFVTDYFGIGPIVQQHPLYDFAWQSVEANALPLDQINVPMLHISGWYDHETESSIRDMQGLQAQGGPNARNRQKMLIGPWSHSHVGDLQQAQVAYPAAEFESSKAAKEWFDLYLRGIGNGYESRSKFRYFQTNEDRWLVSDVWPPAATTVERFYLYSSGTLETVQPATGAGQVSYTSDPADPVPTRFGAILTEDDVTTQGPGDLREIENRPDVLTFSTPALAEPLRAAGRPQAILYMSADVVHTDLAVRMTQVFPDGRSILLVDGIQRASLRSSLSQKTLLEPNKIYEVRVALPSVAVTIPAGHRLRISVASTNYDRFDKNMQDGASFSDAPGAVAKPGTIRIYANSQYPSQLQIPIAPPASAENWTLY